MYYRTRTTLKGLNNRSLPRFQVLFIPLKGGNGQYNYRAPYKPNAFLSDEELMLTANLIYIEYLGCWYVNDLLEQTAQEEVTITFTL